MDSTSVRKTKAKNIILLAGFYEITAWGIHFWGYVYISVSVYERERERGELLKDLGGDRPWFIRLSRVL